MLVCSFEGHETEFVSTKESNNLDSKLNEGLTMQSIVIVGYGRCNFCSGCCCGIYISYEDWQNPLTSTTFSYGFTKLTYEVDISSKDYRSQLENRFNEKKPSIKYLNLYLNSAFK